jgi:hypothetical protein
VTNHRVRATQEPGVVREVSDAELLDLARMGILHSFEHTDEAKAVLDGVTVGKLKAWKDPDRGDEIVTPDPAMTDTKGA